MSRHCSGLRVALVDPALFTLPYDLRLAAALEAEGHRVTFFGKALSAGESEPEEVPLRQHFYGEMVRLGIDRWPPRIAKFAKGAFHILGMRRLVGTLMRERPDAIHFQWLPLPAVDRTFLTALRRIAPLILTAHDSRPFNENPSSIAQKLGATSLFRLVDRVIIHTEQARQRLVAYGVPPERLAQIAHGFLDDAVSIVPPRQASSAPVRFLLFGKIKPYKGVDLLIAALRRLPPEERARCEVLVIGKPYMDTAPLLAAAEGLSPAIRFDFRFVPDEEMPQLFAWADVLLFPYREIDMSGVLMAALRTGRPMIAARIGGFAELLEDDRHGVLVPPGDIDALSRALGRMIREPEMRSRMSAALNELVSCIPSWRAIARRTAEVYADALAERRR